MGSDPRERVKYAPFILNRKGDDTWSVGCNRPAPWRVVVAFAKAILAADAEWQGLDAPTLEELRERYPGRLFGVRKNVPCGPTFCDEAWIEGVVGTPHYSTEDCALRWLAAELAKVNGGT